MKKGIVLMLCLAMVATAAGAFAAEPRLVIDATSWGLALVDIPTPTYVTSVFVRFAVVDSLHGALTYDQFDASTVYVNGEKRVGWIPYDSTQSYNVVVTKPGTGNITAAGDQYADEIREPVITYRSLNTLTLLEAPKPGARVIAAVPAGASVECMEYSGIITNDGYTRICVNDSLAGWVVQSQLNLQKHVTE